MPRHKKNRYVKYPPVVSYFKPQGKPLWALEQVTLYVEEYEALRLSDFEGLTHNESANKMKVSRPTFTRIINSAHKKVADAIINGKAIRIEGGHFILINMRFFCEDCRNVWGIRQEDKIPDTCPNCGSKNIINLCNQYSGRFRHRHKGG